MNKRISAGEQFAQEFMGKKLQQDVERITAFAGKTTPYHRIGEMLINIANLKEVLQVLIDDYTVDKLMSSGELISEDLLSFQQWLDKKYPNEDLTP